MYKTTLLVDSNNLAMRILTVDSYNSVFVNESQINKFITAFLSKLLKTVVSINSSYKIDNILLIWDHPKNGRKEVYPEYKKRNNIDQRFMNYNKLMVALKEAIAPLGNWTTITQENYECDDLIAYIVKSQPYDKNYVILSNDSDFFQLLGQRVIIYNISKKSFYSMTDFQKEFDIIPEKYAQVKALAGDRSDNVIGVDGIGIKKAVKMIQQGKCWTYWLEKYPNIDLELNLELIKIPFAMKGIDPIITSIQSNFNKISFIEMFQKHGLNNLNISDFKNILNTSLILETP